MKQYLDLLRDIVDNGYDHSDRTGTGRRSVFGRMFRFNLKDGFPIPTTRKIHLRGVIEELLWIISGSCNNQPLVDKNVKIWSEWAVTKDDITGFIEKHVPEYDQPIKDGILIGMSNDFEGSIGNLYGKAWRDAPVSMYNTLSPFSVNRDIAKDKLAKFTAEWDEVHPLDAFGEPVSLETFLELRSTQTIDQLHNLIVNLRERPYSSRLVISAWIPEFIPYEGLTPQENVLLGKGALAPCHVLQQYLVSPPATPGGRMRLSLMLTQRSADTPLGVSYNIPSYALLLMIVAQVVDMDPHEFVYSIGDAHIYFNQLEGVQEQLKCEPKVLPKMIINQQVMDITDFKIEDFVLEGYAPHPHIAYAVSI